MQDEEVRALAERHSATLENALNILKSFQYTSDKLGGPLGLVEAQKLRQRKEAAESAWNRASGAIGDAVRAAGVQMHTTLSSGRAIDTIPSALFHDGTGYPFIKRARGIVEAAAGRWEEYATFPARFPRAEGSPRERADAAPEPAPLPPLEPSKVPLSRILRDMTVGEWVAVVGGVIAVISATAWVVKWGTSRQIDDAKRERDQCVADLKAARSRPIPTASPSAPP